MKLTGHIISTKVTGNNTLINVKCPFCGKVYSVTVLTDQYMKYVKGEHPQTAFRGTLPATREAIMTGICSKCWDATCGDE